MTEMEKINQEIAVLEIELKSCKGRETEVYSRIVGFYGSILKHQPGKMQEISERKMFDIPLAMQKIEKGILK